MVSMKHELVKAEELIEHNGTCEMPTIVKMIGGKWKLIILQILIFSGTKRANELLRLIDGATQSVLTSQLRALEEDGLVQRKIYPEVPPRVEYSATQSAVELTCVFDAMKGWWLKQLASEATDIGKRGENGAG